MDFLSSGFNVVLIILGFGLLIFVHELGHFIAAKWAGIRTEAFAIGMGPVMIAWRKGIGFRFGSTGPAYEARVREHLTMEDARALQFKEKTPDRALSQTDLYRIGDKLGLGETEYSLRWLPIGGFVKMLGQEDANPNAVSDDPRSYNMRPIGKRMVVVSAGVIMNLLLAIVLFIMAFMIGVRFEAPVVGDVSDTLPAGRVQAINAEALEITEVGLQPGDEIAAIDGEPARTFADLQIASAMGRPDTALTLTVKRSGTKEPLTFVLKPEKDTASGLLSIGVAPGSSTTLRDRDEEGELTKALERTGLRHAGVKPGMRLVQAGGQPVQTYEQFQKIIDESDGKPVLTEWLSDFSDQGAEPMRIAASIELEPSLQLHRYPSAASTDAQNFEFGLFGLVPLTNVKSVVPGPNQTIFKAGDVILQAGDKYAPRMADLRKLISQHKPGKIKVVVLRDGKELSLNPVIDRTGRLNIDLGYAYDLPITAEPLEKIRSTSSVGADVKVESTPVAGLDLLPGTRFEAIGGVPVGGWADIRRELRAQTAQAKEKAAGASVQLSTVLPTRGNPRETLTLELSPEQIQALHDLGWQSDLPPYVFEPVYTMLSADGNAFKAVAMGFQETRKLIVITYLTIDRLIRGSVGVDQLRGPVGIVHIGTKIADRGFTYLIFFLAMISVNLAVINFLPMPIVDGGLFLFLVYEKLKGRPPSLAFQNAATIVGLFLIGTAFIVTFYNDVLRLLT